MCAHTPLCHSPSHASTESKIFFFTTGPVTPPQEMLSLSVSGCESEVEFGCSVVFYRKAIIVGFIIGFASRLLVTQPFPSPCTVPTNFRPDTIHFFGLYGVNLQMKVGGGLQQTGKLQELKGVQYRTGGSYINTMRA